MQYFKKLLKSIFTRKERIVPVVDTSLSGVSKDLKEDILLSMIDLVKTNPNILKYLMIRMQMHLNDLQRIERPKTDDEMRLYSAKIMEIMARIDECNHLISIPKLAIRVKDKRSKQ